MARRQAALPGMERKTIAELDTAAEHYQSMKKTRMKWTEKEDEAKQKLIELMVKHQIESYKDESVNPPLVIVVVEGKTNVKVYEDDTASGVGDADPDDTPAPRSSKSKKAKAAEKAQRALPPAAEESEMAKATREAREKEEAGKSNGQATPDA